MDRARRAWRDLAGMAARRCALDAAVGARNARSVSAGRMMRGALRRANRKVGTLRRRLFEPVEQTAWRRAWHKAETTPRFTPGAIEMAQYRFRYADLMSFCFQWQDIFVKRCLEFRAASDAPRILDCGANVGL